MEAYLSYLANARKVSASTHHQALSAILFLYREVLGIDLPWMTAIGRPTKPKRIPVVLAQHQVAELLANVHGETGLAIKLLYGTGLRLMECLRLRVKDVDFARRCIVVRESKGKKDRVVMLPASFQEALRVQVRASRELWDKDRQCGRARRRHAGCTRH